MEQASRHEPHLQHVEQPLAFAVPRAIRPPPPRYQITFFSILPQASSTRSLIFPQVQLCKLISPRRGIPARQTYQNKIDRKSVDFVLCNPSTLKPQLIIELDDKSHTREDRKTRDDFVNNALKAAGIPLLRIPAASHYNLIALEQQIRDKIHPPASTAT